MSPSGSIFNPVSPEARAIAHLFNLSLVVCGFIFVSVVGVIVYSLLRFKGREGDPEPEQIAGSKRIEIAWTIVPFLIVCGLFALTVQAMERSDPPVLKEPDLIVVGHQWWWEVRYRKTGLVTANEIHIPLGQPISIRLDTADVLHEFWVPQLTRKMTTVPLAGNHIWIEAEKPGTYQGLCSEFCGTQHAWMRFQVIAETQEQFSAWEQHQLQVARGSEGQAEAGRQLFNQMTCVNCHAIRGTAAVGTAGPDLTHLESRRTLGSCIVANTPANLRRWLADPQEVKPGVKMPNFKLTDPQIDDLLAYFHTLQ